MEWIYGYLMSKKCWSLVLKLGMDIWLPNEQIILDLVLKLKILLAWLQNATLPLLEVVLVLDF